MENVNFKVIGIEPANKPGCVVAKIKFEKSEKIFTYVRKNYGDDSLVIDGCKVIYNSRFEVTSIERVYETKGYKRADTSGICRTTREKITKEIEEKAIEIPQVEIDEKEEVHHEKYEQIKACLECNIPVYLAGPAGSGKNYTVEQIANELGWNFYFSNSVQQEYKLTGFIDAGGKFHDTEFYKACKDEKDCIFFLDEMDASIPEVLVLLNAAIANKYFEFPNGKLTLEHVHFVAAGNTVGSGADDMYSGRMVIDQATLDRFAIIEFGYSMKIEMRVTKGNLELVQFVHQLRDEAERKGIRATFSYRCMTMVTKLEKSGMEIEDILRIAVIKGLDKDTVNTFGANGTTKYHRAFNKIKEAA